jgi:hypothetical protein
MKPNENRFNQQDQTNAAAFEAYGLMAQADYVRLARLPTEAAAGTLSDADLDWALALMAAATEALVRSKVMVTLAALGGQCRLTTEQKERIMAAVAPFADSDHQLDKLSAAHAMKALADRNPHRQTPSDN